MDNTASIGGIRVGSYHKPNKIGRAWYVLLHGEQPTTGQDATIIRKDGRQDHVQVFEPVPYRDGWLCKFKHVGDAHKPQAASALPQPAIAGTGFLGDAQQEKREQVEETVEVDISAALEAARSALAQDSATILASIESRVSKAVKEALESVTGRIEYVNPQGVTVDCGRQHKTFAELLRYVSLGLNVWLPGPAGSGKTSAAANVSKALGFKFYHQGKVLMEHTLLGYMDAQGRYVRTTFRDAYEHGGVFLADECDGSEAKALLPLNMAIEQGEMAFPDGIVKRHADFRVIAAANTFGQGGDSDYVGRNRLDGAFLDRFVFLRWDYDEAFETELSGNAQWAKRVQALRASAKAKGIKVLITPRASIVGGRMLAAGVEQAQVETVTIRKSMTDEQWNTISRGIY
jgi:MoxR-like ATPase